MSFAPYCFGTECPLKGSCNHYKPIINIKKEIHWEKVPYDPIKQKCEFYSNYPSNVMNEEIKRIINGHN